MKTALTLLLLAAIVVPAWAQADRDLLATIDRLAADVEDDVITWRRHVHQNPELSNREVETAAYVAEHLRSLGIEVETEVAHTGVVGVLRGGRPGPVVALRADMDALPVTEQVDLPFASKATATFNGEEVGVMHACGHDTHVAILMGVAEVLASVREELPGTVKFLFQPAEEGAPAGEEGGADLMLKEGAFADPRPEVIFGLHAIPMLEVGQIGYRPGGIMAASDGLRITVRGQQTHAAMPWGGVDPIVTASQIVMGLQTVVSRQAPLITAPAVVSIGQIQGGVRGNIIPDEVELWGTIRTLDSAMQDDIHARVRRTAEHIAASAGATAEVTINRGYPVTHNDPDLTAQMAPTLERVVGADGAIIVDPMLGAEDFSYFAREVPGLFLWLGVRTPGASAEAFPPNHSPLFQVDEDALIHGVRALAHLTADYMAAE